MTNSKPLRFRAFILSLFILTLSSAAFAQTEEVGTWGVRQTGTETYVHPAFTDMTTSSVFPGLGGIGSISNIGSVIWDIFKYNKPTANVETDMATGLPADPGAWQKLVGWRTEIKDYNLFYDISVNKKKHRVIDFNYRVMYTHSGSINGHGKYLTGITALPMSWKIRPGFQLNASIKVPQATVLNVGTPEEPIAAARIHLMYQMKSWTKDVGGTKIYEVLGNGGFSEVE